jgi:hypothetical protein
MYRPELSCHAPSALAMERREGPLSLQDHGSQHNSDIRCNSSTPPRTITLKRRTLRNQQGRVLTERPAHGRRTWVVRLADRAGAALG